METRRNFLKAAVSSMMMPVAMIAAAEGKPTLANGTATTEADFLRWYDVDRRMVNLENAYWNVMSKPVMEEYWSQTQFVNRVNVPFVRSGGQLRWSRQDIW